MAQYERYTSRTGFQYQDLYLIYRVLRKASDALHEAWVSGTTDVLRILDDSPVRFGIEASRRTTEASQATNAPELDWDVLVLSARRLEFAEVKSGAITKEDRITFWCRLRRELSKPSNTVIAVVPVLVVDPNRAGELEKWQRLASAATTFIGSPPSAEPTNNVLDANHVLNEALWFLCRPNSSTEKGDPTVSASLALTALSQFQVHCHAAQQLDSDVLQLLELLFPGGLAETEQKLLLGWLSERATDPAPDRRLFTIRELLAEIGILENALSLTTGNLKEWHDLWNEAPQGVIARSRLRLGDSGGSIPALKVQPTALAAVSRSKSRSLVILGHGGIGKSTFLAQTAENAMESGDIVLHRGADDLTAEELEKLIKAFRFCASLAAIKDPNRRVCILVDGLDEADVPLRKRWAQLLLRLAGLPNAYAFVAIRDAIWNDDGELRKALASWPTASLELWPEKLIRDLLTPTPYHDALPQSVIELLRTPILLDFFWRTFVDGNTHDVSLASRLQTRHNLLAVYWEKRLVFSPRYASVQGLQSRLAQMCSKAIRYIGPFPEADLNIELVQVLLSEGILAREGRLHSRLRFRHPLLRDFAFAQWCLAADNPSAVASRLNSIQGGLQRYGALRAIFESLSDWNARSEYPQLEVGKVVQAIACAEPALAGQVAQILGTHLASPGLNPATWSPTVQASLPGQFGRELLAAARVSRNGSWAASVEAWPDSARWLSKEYSKELWQYASVLVAALKLDPKNHELREHCRQATRKLRHTSETEPFASEFAEGDRWLKMQSMLLVIPVLPDDPTLAWVEREMTQSSWRTRSHVLEMLIHLAPVDADRTAAIYRKAVGLSKESNRFPLSASPKGAVMDHQMIEWSLAGDGERRGLLKEHPEKFLLLAVDLAEAFWHDQQEDRNNTGIRIGDFIRELDPSWSKEAEAESERQRQDNLSGLIDDSPEYGYWRSLPGRDPHERCLLAIHECAARYARADPEKFILSIYPILRSARLASIQSILLDILLDQKQRPEFANSTAEIIPDSRLYYVSGIEYWLEQSIIGCWRSTRDDQRRHFFDVLRALLKTSEEEHNAKNFLLRIPIEDLPEDLRALRPAEDDPEHLPYPRPVRSSINLEGVPIEDDDERAIGSWPDDFDREVLMQFVRAMKHIPRQASSEEDPTRKLMEAVQPALSFVSLLRDRKNLLQTGGRPWVWRELARFLEAFRRLKEGKATPPEELVNLCTELALSTLKNLQPEVPGDLPEDGLIHYNETPWSGALHLADAALTWDPVASDQAIQNEFSRILETTFTDGNPMAQFLCAHLVRPWHWFRDAERRQLHDRLVWNLPKQASVLAASLGTSGHYSDDDRARVFRILLSRNDVQPPKQLAHWLGQYIGVGSMVVFADGKRSAVAELAREAIETPERFALLRESTNRREFLRQMAFGMKEQASVMWSHAELAADYGNWACKIWRVLRRHRQRRNESEGVVLITMHWLEGKERQNRDTVKLKTWWDCLQPLLNAVVTEGGRADCFTLFYNLHGGGYNDLTTPEELIGMGETLARRIQLGVRDGRLQLDGTDSEQHEWHSWRESTEFLAEMIDSLRRDGLLQTDARREQAHRLLSTLAADPIQSSKAREVLHRLQNE